MVIYRFVGCVKAARALVIFSIDDTGLHTEWFEKSLHILRK